MPNDDYAAVPSTGKLKLKGVTDSRVDKKKKKKKRPQPEDGDATATATTNQDDFVDNSVILKSLEEEDDQISKESHKQADGGDDNSSNRPVKAITTPVGVKDDAGDDDVREHLKTDAERRFDEQRRKRLEERLKREGVKSHKQRVEELNRYLSTLSEHHDMPRIGPG